MKINKIAVIGAGPAGGTCAMWLAKAGFEVYLFDHKAPWNKPCAGAISTKVFDRFPELEPLKEYGYPNKIVRIITLDKKKVEFELERPLYTVSRKRLGEFLIDKAKAYGARFLKNKITSIELDKTNVKLNDDEERSYLVDFLIDASGIASILRKKLKPRWSKEDYSFTLSILLPIKMNVPLTFQFFKGLKGYSWVFPQNEATSIGIGAIPIRPKMNALQNYLRETIESEKELGEFKIEPKTLTKALIPALSLSTLLHQKVVGENWALIGDLAGAANRALGAGILYALQNARDLADSLISANPHSYQEKFWKMCKNELIAPIFWGPAFYTNSCQKTLSWVLANSDSAKKMASQILSNLKISPPALILSLFKMFLEALF